jgi:hypothetical protein
LLRAVHDTTCTSLTMLPKGWKGSASLFCIFCTLVFAVNLGVLIWAVQHKRRNGDAADDDGAMILREGSDVSECTKIQTLNKWAHLVINLLSTVLLSGSNCCMQCLSAPTRSDIDRSHGRSKWLDIGIPSVHNFQHIPRKRLVLWLILGISSLPLHLL